MRIKSIRARLTFWYTSLFSVTFLLLAGAAYWLLGYSLARDVDASLTGVSKILVEQAHKSATPFFPNDVDKIFRQFFGFSPLGRYFEMLDPTGRPDTQRAQPRPKRPLLSQRALKNAGQGLSTFETMEGVNIYPVRVLTVPVIKAGRVINMVQVGMSLEGIHKTRRRFLIIIMGLLPICILLAGGGGWFFAHRALRPVDHMASAAERISGEALSERLETTGTDDELDRLANTLNRMLTRLDSAFDQIREFSANASHELQTPLTIIKGELEVSLRAERSREEYRQVLDSALEEINRLVHLVDGLLLLARADAGVLRMDLRPLDPARILKEVYQQTKVLAHARNIDLQADKMDAVSINGDYEQLRRLLLNLVDNAIKYTDAGGQVTLSLQREEEWVTLQVTDTGIGIPPEEKKHILQAFYRANHGVSRSERGVGLGLSIVKSITEAHGGKLEIDSAPGQGSTFKVILPKQSTSVNRSQPAAEAQDHQRQ